MQFLRGFIGYCAVSRQSIPLVACPASLTLLLLPRRRLLRRRQLLLPSLENYPYGFCFGALWFPNVPYHRPPGPAPKC